MRNELELKRFIYDSSNILGISYDELTGRYRGDRHCIIRYVIWDKLRDFGLTLGNIGILFGRSHSAVYHGISNLRMLESSKDKGTIAYINYVKSEILYKYDTILGNK